MLHYYSFEFGHGESKHSVRILPGAQAIVLTHASRTQLNGLYTPVPIMPWTGALHRPFCELVEYVGDNKTNIKQPWLRVAFGRQRRLDVEFWPYFNPCDQTSVPFVKVSDCCYMDGLRLAQRRIRDNPRRLALAMALHPRLGKESPLLRCGGEDILRIIAALL